MLGYQVIGSIIADATSITSGTTFTVSSISLPHGVWNIFSQVGWKCSSKSAGATMTYNGFSLSNSSSFGIFVIENYNNQNVSNNNTYSNQICRVQTIGTNVNVSLLCNLVFTSCTMVTVLSTSILSATRIA